jgi:hypothetical protein
MIETDEELLKYQLMVFTSENKDEMCTKQQGRLEARLGGFEPINHNDCEKCTGVMYTEPFTHNCKYYFNMAYVGEKGKVYKP